jgi:hypothetical protein
MNTFIYGLVSKESPNEIRYIGKSDNPSYRLKRHIYLTKYSVKKNKNLTHKDYWIIKNNYEIDFIILEECDNLLWSEKEKEYILKHANLTNTSSGGLGGCGITYKMTYDETKSWIQKNLKIKSKSDWYRQIKTLKLPDYICKYPSQAYKKRGWISWIDFLGTNNKYDNNVYYISYEEAKLKLKEFKFKCKDEYTKYHKNKQFSFNIPLKPFRYYGERGWVSWSDYLSNNKVANIGKKFVSLDEFIEIVEQFGFKSEYQYRKSSREFRDTYKLPAVPSNQYKNDGWVLWGSWNKKVRV